MTPAAPARNRSGEGPGDQAGLQAASRSGDGCRKATIVLPKPSDLGDHSLPWRIFALENLSDGAQATWSRGRRGL